MKNIYDLLNHAEDSDDIISESEKVELSETDKRRIYNRILLNSESNNGNACEADAYNENERQNKNALEGHSNRKIRKILAAAACMALICVVGFTAGAAVKEHLYNNTRYDYREKLENSEPETVEDNGISGVTIQMKEVRRVEDSLAFDCTFHFEGDIGEMQTEMEKWAVEEGRNAIFDRLFENAEVYVDGVNVLDDDFASVIAQTDAYAFGQHVSFEEKEMQMTVLIYPLSVGEDHTIQFCFKDLNMGDHVLEGSWEYTYEARADAYEDELEWQNIAIEAQGRTEKITLTQYAITPNGPKIDAAIEKKDDTDDIDQEDGYSKLETLRIVAWDDLGNYYLMYGSSKDYDIEEPTTTYHERFDIYDGEAATQEGLKNRDYRLVWDENASTLTFVIEKETAKWDIKTGKYVGDDYEFISEPYEVDLTK